MIHLTYGWTLCATTPDEYSDPHEFAASKKPSIAVEVPGSFASAVHLAKSELLDARAPDDFDVWYQNEFDAPGHCFESTNSTYLRFEGLATIADVWLNGLHVLRSENMFCESVVPTETFLRPGSNILQIRFSSLNRFLTIRRPRPRWRTHLLDDPQLRWVRTTLLGRLPGWHHNAEKIHCVGPWRPITLITDTDLRIASSRFSVAVDDDFHGSVRAAIEIESLSGAPVREAFLEIGDRSIELGVTETVDRMFTVSGTVRLASVRLWSPHTHGDQPLYPVRVSIRLASGETPPITIDFGKTGFRTVDLDTHDDGFGFSVNGRRIFARGACWTTLDPLNLIAEESAYDRSVGLAAAAGMNMLRVPGIAFYESDDFYDACATHGITVWQDFALALMDYPSDDPAFLASLATEVRQLLDRIELNPALTLLCGNSECAGIAAMSGLLEPDWHSPLFDEFLPGITSELRQDVPFYPTSQWGGGLPFHVNSGVTNYYGIGAYLRPLDDARRSGLRFAAESLAFANIPEQQTVDRFLENRQWPGNHPSWKAAVPRNVSLGWDFDDVRDHYVQSLLGEDASVSRFSDSARYLALGRVAIGEAMAGAFNEWRRAGSLCDGALVFFFQDLWPGAGWGIFDSFGCPKSVYYYLKRALAPVAVFFTDEGLSGLQVQVVNERPEGFSAILRITFYRHGKNPIRETQVRLDIEPHGCRAYSVDGLLGSFIDTTYAYRFGPPAQDVTVAVLESIDDGTPLAVPTFFFPAGAQFVHLSELDFECVASSRQDSSYELVLKSSRFAQAVNIETPGFLPEDNYFHLEPGRERRVVVARTRASASRPFAGTVGSLNSWSRTKIAVHNG